VVKRADLPLIDVLRAIDQSPSAAHVPSLFPQFPYKIVMARLMQMEDKGLIDYGVVITRPWLTGKGSALLRDS
jgi:hypothetical protein